MKYDISVSATIDVRMDLNDFEAMSPEVAAQQAYSLLSDYVFDNVDFDPVSLVDCFPSQASVQEVIDGAPGESFNFNSSELE